MSKPPEGFRIGHYPRGLRCDRSLAVALFMIVGLESLRPAVGWISVFESVTIRTENDTPLDLLANACLRVAINDHGRDAVFFFVWMVKVETRWSVFVTASTLAVSVLGRVEPSPDFRPATILSLDSFLPVLVVPALLACEVFPTRGRQEYRPTPVSAGQADRRLHRDRTFPTLRVLSPRSSRLVAP